MRGTQLPKSQPLRPTQMNLNIANKPHPSEPEELVGWSEDDGDGSLRSPSPPCFAPLHSPPPAAPIISSQVSASHSPLRVRTPHAARSSKHQVDTESLRAGGPALCAALLLSVVLLAVVVHTGAQSLTYQQPAGGDGGRGGRGVHRVG